MRLILLLLWTTFTSTQCSSSDVAPPLTAAAFSRDGNFLLTGSQAGVQVRTWPSLAVHDTLNSEMAHVHDLKFSADGGRLLIAGGSPAEFGTVEVMDWTDRRVVRRVSAHGDVVYQVAWLNDDIGWATASGDRTCQVRSGDDVGQQAVFKGHSQPVLSVSTLHDHELVASTGTDQTLRIWNRRTGQTVRTLDNHVGPVSAVVARAISPITDMPALLTPIVATVSDDRTVRFWNPATGRMLRFAKLSTIPRAAVWSHTGHLLFVGCDDGSVVAVDPEDTTTRTVSRPDGRRIFEIIIHPSEPALVTAGESGLRVIAID